MHNIRKASPVLALLAAVSLYAFAGSRPGLTQKWSGYKVLDPIAHRNLTIFPIVAGSSPDTANFLTLDEGVRSGEVVVTEAGRVAPLIRRPLRRPLLRDGPRGQPWPERPNQDSPGGYPEDQVNKLVLVNNSDRPLILLAGEIVTGGKQDRIVGKDRIVPAKSDPIDLGVFCVEPHRWTETASRFGSMNFLMAQPSVRKSAMADKNQQEVWNQVGRASGGIAGAAPSAVESLRATSSYARVMQNRDVWQSVDAVAAPLTESYQHMIRELRTHNAVGVVVAVNGQFIWADIFASNALLDKYWPKLIRSYAAEALTTGNALVHHSNRPEAKAAQAFLENFQGRREIVESEPGVYRHTEIDGDAFRAFELTSLLPAMSFDLHVAKMAD